ncbi:kinase-like domain-containing protein [Ampelomyces quisqualis]|uniref:Kinase-like domain-containing protein n=1 Tax=Ampelomyces quisqualis TaxID=50730 RepID=A0A6A5QR91_AMPQU|nr:kinase-like domain-containing protein [Ampelomyces quisqualis]
MESPGRRLADSNAHPSRTNEAPPRPAAAPIDAASSASHALLPAFATASSPFHCHIRAPSTGLTVQTDFSAYRPPPPTATLEAHGSEPATAPITIPHDQGYLRTACSANSAGSLSPGSVLSSPALNALGDMTPLPSPLVMSDSPGPWQRALPRPRSRAASGSSLGDSLFSPTAGTLSPSGSLKKKGYQRLKQAAIEAAAASHSHPQHGAAHGRNRSMSEFTPDALHNARPRHVTIGNTSLDGDTRVQQQMHREVYLAATRGLVSGRQAASLPTPPASNASNRSVTDTDEEDVAEDGKTKYIVVRQGPERTKKLWRPVRQLGQGTFSKVYLATCEKTEAKDPLDEAILDPRKLVAIKVVEHGPAGGADEERVELSLKREVEMLRSVSHPSLVHLQALDHDDAQALLVLTYCPGGDLFDVASDHCDKLTIGLVQRIFAEMVSAVRYLHDQLIVHRDIKLENVLLNVPVSTVALLKDPQKHPHAIATLTDLGLSRRVPAPPESPLLTTRCGSEDYAAPEILLGQPYDGRSTDAWALGVLLYALMEGRLPFDPPPGKPARGRAVHRIARCDWVWTKFGDADGEWDDAKGKDWAGARECVEGLLKKATRGRKSLQDISKMEWVLQGIQVEGGLKSRPEDEVVEITTSMSSR